MRGQDTPTPAFWVDFSMCVWLYLLCSLDWPQPQDLLTNKPPGLLRAVITGMCLHAHIGYSIFLVDFFLSN